MKDPLTPLKPGGMVLAPETTQVTCPECGGCGYLMDDPSATFCPGADRCWYCDGRGWAWHIVDSSPPVVDAPPM